MQPDQETCTTPVIFLAYNRPRETVQVMQRIRQARPARLLAVCDGPRPESPGDQEKCEEVRKIIHDLADWDCELSTRFAPSNQGCGKNISSGLDWAFSQVDEAIILEDDCLPDPTFFRYCEELLQYYREEPSIAQICGYNGIDSITTNIESSYFFSRFGPVWGWATWKRAWDLYDFSMEDWPIRSDSHWMHSYPGTSREKLWRKSIYSRVQNGYIDTWDYQWDYAKFKHNVLSVIPAVNLIENIGFGADATHTKSYVRQPKSRNIHFPLIHPADIKPMVKFDRAILKRDTPWWPILGWQFLRRIILKGFRMRFLL